MAVSKRLRYEIMRRDNHACRYCGGMAPDVKLTVDHVLPSALGGTDDPSNLVTACKDCNAGKTSVHPDTPVVQQVSDDALRWADAVRQAFDAASADLCVRDEYRNAIANMWTGSAPSDWAKSLELFRCRGMPIAMLRDAAEKAQGNRKIAASEQWRYFMGCAWRMLDEITNSAKHIFDDTEPLLCMTCGFEIKPNTEEYGEIMDGADWESHHYRCAGKIVEAYEMGRASLLSDDDPWAMRIRESWDRSHEGCPSEGRLLRLRKDRPGVGVVV